ncbi:MAG: T9SS C-terminal target domain-containing protein [Flavobacteriia bacterium]|nr:T9SS C-terminal target domain-containing protein [Flavobacteriia bacterium]
MGRVLIRESLNDSGKNTIDLSNIPSGMYVVRLLGKAQQATESLWIRK